MAESEFINSTKEALPPYARRYANWALATAIITFLLITAGGIVRAAGAGMGCPDWPRCFGMWIPPTEASQLPADYLVRFAEHINPNDPFNAVKTWTEYLNRLLGALTGLFALATLWLSLPFLSNTDCPRDRSIFWLSFGALLLIMFEAWLGKTIVDSNLHQAQVTAHLVGAVGVALLYVLANIRVRGLHRNPLLDLQPGQQGAGRIGRLLQVGTLLAVAVVGVQFWLGTGVRETIDTAVERFGAEPGKWMQLVDGRYYLHRTLAIGVLALIAALAFLTHKYLRGSILHRLLVASALLTMAQFLTGVVLSQFDLPAAVRVLHVLMSTMVFTFVLASAYLAWPRLARTGTGAFAPTLGRTVARPVPTT